MLLSLEEPVRKIRRNVTAARAQLLNRPAPAARQPQLQAGFTRKDTLTGQIFTATGGERLYLPRVLGSRPFQNPFCQFIPRSLQISGEQSKHYSQ